VPEQDAELGAVIVGRHDKTPVHVGMPAGFPYEQLTDGVDVCAGLCGGAPFEHGLARNRRCARRHDAERFPRCVVIRRTHWTDHADPLERRHRYT
jgi:hypothetical protein